MIFSFLSPLEVLAEIVRSVTVLEVTLATVNVRVAEPRSSLPVMELAAEPVVTLTLPPNTTEPVPDVLSVVPVRPSVPV